MCLCLFFFVTVLPFHSAAEALYTLKEKEGEFDLILIEVHVGFTGFVSLTGFKLLEHIENEFNIPVISKSVTSLAILLNIKHYKFM